MKCPTGKIAYRRRHSAHRHAKQVTKRNRMARNSGRVGLEAGEYPCPDCGFWHVRTLNPKPVGR